MKTTSLAVPGAHYQRIEKQCSVNEAHELKMLIMYNLQCLKLQMYLCRSLSHLWLHTTVSGLKPPTKVVLELKKVYKSNKSQCKNN